MMPMKASSQQDRIQSTEWRLLILLAAIQFTNNVDFMIMMPLGPKLMRIFEIGPKQFSWLVSAYTFAGAFSGLLAAIFLDKFDRKKTLHFTYSFFILGNIGCALSPTYVWLLFFRIFAGLFGGILSAQILSIVGDNIPESRRGRAMGIIMAAFSAAAVFGIPFCLWIADLYSWHAPFYFLSVFAAFLWIGIQIEVPQQRKHLSKSTEKNSALGGILIILKTPGVIRAISLIPFVMLGFFTMIPMLNPFLVANVGVPENRMALMYLLGGFATLFTSPIAGKLVDRIGAFKVFAIVSLGIGPVLILISRLTPSPLWFIYLHTTTLFILGNGRMVSSMSLITGVVPPRIRGGFMSLVSSAQQIASGTAAFVGGALVSKAANGEIIGYTRSAVVSLIFGLTAIFVASRIPKSKKEHFHGESLAEPL
jgi:predicted MFS family arabinose efflux permease